LAERERDCSRRERKTNASAMPLGYGRDLVVEMLELQGYSDGGANEMQ
jgi:hypothetical protein